jgi:endo-1,4-beta-mannosidase
MKHRRARAAATVVAVVALATVALTSATDATVGAAPITSAGRTPSPPPTQTSPPKTTVFASRATTARRAPSSPLANVRLVNYYPADHGWSRMWLQWDPATIRADFGRIAAMGGNAVRLVLQYDAFGYPTPTTAMTSRLASAVSMASQSGLRVQLTLFDSFRSYGDVAGSRRWAGAVLAPYRGDTRIVFVELQNEIDARNASAMAWARQMIPYVRWAAARPVAISGQEYGTWNLRGFSDLVKALGSARPDIFSFHLYGSPNDAATKLTWAKKLAAPTPLFIGEAGQPTSELATAASDPVREQWQLYFFKVVEHEASVLGLPPAAPWILRDFVPGTLGSNVAGRQYHFGLVRVDGSAKPAYVWLSSYFRSLAA